MADTEEIRYLSTPREPFDETEIQYVREQAEVFNSLRKNDSGYDLLYKLVPACWTCSSDKLHRNFHQCCFICETCGHRTDDIHLRSGRIAYR